MTFHIVLLEPEIPPNTGNIIRICANSGAKLHLIRPLGFDLDDRNLRRAGLDYHDAASVSQYESYADFLLSARPQRVFAVSTRGRCAYGDADYLPGDAFVFGPETRGLPQAMLDEMPADRVLRIPMVAGSRSLNLSNAVAIVLYEAWRQAGFAGAAGQARNGA